MIHNMFLYPLVTEVSTLSETYEEWSHPTYAEIISSNDREVERFELVWLGVRRGPYPDLRLTTYRDGRITYHINVVGTYHSDVGPTTFYREILRGAYIPWNYDYTLGDLQVRWTEVQSC